MGEMAAALQERGLYAVLAASMLANVWLVRQLLSKYAKDRMEDRELVTTVVAAVTEVRSSMDRVLDALKELRR